VKAEYLIAALIVIVAALLTSGGMELGKELYDRGQTAGLNVCEVRMERYVRDVDSLTVLIRTLEEEVLGE